MNLCEMVINTYVDIHGWGIGDTSRIKRNEVIQFMNETNGVNDLIAVRQDDTIIILNQGDIFFFERVNRKTLIHTIDHMYESNKAITYYEERLKDRDFFRSHKSSLINLTKIDRCVPQVNYTFDVLFRESEKTAPVSRQKAKNLMKLLGI